MRCPDCNKFVSQEAGEPEVQSLEIYSGEVQAEVRVVVNCAECGKELKETTLTLNEPIPDEIVEAHKSDDCDLQIEETESETLDEYKTTDRHGKHITNSRYHVHEYGARVAFSVTCSCGKEPCWDGEFEDKVPASAMDELV